MFIVDQLPDYSELDIEFRMGVDNTCWMYGCWNH